MPGLSIRVECHAGYRADEYPRRFALGSRWLEVTEIVDRWLSPQRRYFKVRADDGCIYILCHDAHQGWDLHLYDSDDHPDTQLSSS